LSFSVHDHGVAAGLHAAAKETPLGLGVAKG
jgi:hypothetical protein